MNDAGNLLVAAGLMLDREGFDGRLTEAKSNAGFR